MSVSRHIAAQTTLYKKDDINLDTYCKHTKTQTDKPPQFKIPCYNTLKDQRPIMKKPKKNCSTSKHQLITASSKIFKNENKATYQTKKKKLNRFLSASDIFRVLTKN
jgi:hypothetical protein